MRLKSLSREARRCVASALAWLLILPLAPLLPPGYALWQKAGAGTTRGPLRPTGTTVPSVEGLLFNLR
ncbi:MAG: hypothetical protein ABIU29_07195 [Chthoniobacterales bacterium]